MQFSELAEVTTSLVVVLLLISALVDSGNCKTTVKEVVTSVDSENCTEFSIHHSRVCYGIMRARSWGKCSFSHKWIYMIYELWDSVRISINVYSDKKFRQRNKTIHLHLWSNRHWWGGWLCQPVFICIIQCHNITEYITETVM